MRRLALQDREGGAFAILYAVLVVVLIGMAAVVVDFAAVRQDRRLDRSAADSAALGGVALLDNTSANGPQPYQACLRAWDYLAATLRISVPTGACSAFDPATHPALRNIATYCSATPPAEIADDQVVGRRLITVAWPVPSSGGSGFLNPDLAPGTATQPANTAATPGPTNTDGYSNGCDKLGVLVQQQQDFGLGTALGVGNGTTTQVHSVARVIPQQGPEDDVAALNVLNPTSCESLVTTGNGKVTVGPTLDDNNNPVGPGIVAVESNATTSCNGGTFAIDPTTGRGSLICASLTGIGAGLCDGKGRILSHALDPGGNTGQAYNPAAVPSNLMPRPTPEGGVHSWVPVTRHYGCNGLSNCQAPATNYVRRLAQVYKGPGIPTTLYDASQSPYVSPYQTPFVTPTADANGNPINLCPGGGGITTTIVVAPGNIYVPCTLNIKNGGTVIFRGGTVVVNGAIAVTSGGCFVVNTAAATCPATVSGSGARVTSPIQPTSDAIVFIRGSGGCGNYCFDNAGTLVMPQTFVYNYGSAPLNQGSTTLTLWTAPAAGAVISGGRTTLELACGATSSVPANQDCMDSRFGRMTYWSEDPSPSTKPNQFAGQGSLNVVGVFFTPLAYFNFTGGGGYTGAAAQFWADKLNVNGGANLGLSPFASFSLPSFGPDLVLIR